MIKRFGVIGFLFITLALITPAPHANALMMPTTEKIKQIETDHFKILYQESLSTVAPALTGYCEQAYAVLTRMLEFEPSEKITVYLVDNFDTHNGWATVVPRNTMSIFMAGTDQASQIYQPGNYLQRTIYHELMHVMSMDMRGGYNALLEKIFGKIDPTAIGTDPVAFLMFLATSSPNMLAPNWYLEGISMYAETEFAGPGRGRSTLGDMLFRTAVKEDNLLPYSKWYLETPRWPYGAAAYWYGMRMIQYLSESSEHPNPVGETTRAISKVFLFNFNSGIRDVTEKHWKTLATEMLQQERRHQTANIEKLETVAFTPVSRLTPKTMAISNIRYAGEKIFLMATTEEKRNTLYVFDPQTGTLEKISRARTPFSIGDLSATADGRLVYYTTINIMDSENFWYELRRYDTATGKAHTLTREGRYRSVDISPDGNHLAVISQRKGVTYLLEVPTQRAGDPKHEKTLASTALEADVAAPRFSPDGRHIAYVKADKQGFQLMVYDRASGQHRGMWRTKHQIIAPSWRPDGKEIVFSCDVNGVYNLYRLPLKGTKTPAPLTHVWGGLFRPVFSGDGSTLAAIHCDGFGPHLVMLPYTPDALTGKTLPVISPTWSGGKMKALKAELQSEQLDPKLSTDKLAERKYNSLTAIRPDFWTPWLNASTYGVQGGLAAAFSDPSNHQNLRVMVGMESEYGTPLADIHYNYTDLLSLYGSLGQSAYPNLLTVSETTTRFDYAEETQLIGAAIAIPVYTRLNRQITMNVGYEFLQREVIEEVEEEYDGLDLTLQPTKLDQGSAWGRLDYFSGTLHRRSVSVEDGALISLGAEYSNPSLGGDIDATRVLVDINQYITMPYSKNHVLKISGSYVTGWGDDYAQGLISVGGFNSSPAAARPGITRSLGLRGYNTNYQTGQSAVRAGASYRFPVLNIFKGLESGFPLYNRDLFLEVFYEGGQTYDDNSVGDDVGWLNAAGVEVNYGFSILRFVRFAPGIGVVYAPQRDDRDPDNGDEDEYEEVVPYFSLKLWANF